MSGFKQTEIGLIPEDWKVVKLGEVVEFSRKPRSLRIRENDELPFIPMELIPDSGKYASWLMKKYSEISSGTFVFKDDIIVAKITPSFKNGKQALLTNLPMEFGYATTEVLAFHPKNEDIIHSVASIVSGQHGSFPSGFLQILGACALPRPHLADSKPGREAFPRHLPHKTPPPLLFAASPPWPAAPAG